MLPLRCAVTLVLACAVAAGCGTSKPHGATDGGTPQDSGADGRGTDGQTEDGSPSDSDGGGTDAGDDASAPITGITWTREQGGPGDAFSMAGEQALAGVTVTPEGSVLAVGSMGNGNSANPLVMRKPAGSAWQFIAPAGSSMLVDTHAQYMHNIASDDDAVVVLGTNENCPYSSGLWLSTDDGVTWADHDGSDRLCYPGPFVTQLVNSRGTFVAAGGAAGSNFQDPEVYTSPDGLTWTKRTLPERVPIMEGGPPASLFDAPWSMAVDGHGTVMLLDTVTGTDLYAATRILVSTDDGATWADATPPVVPQGEMEPQALAFGDGKWVVINMANELFVSDDAGQSWTKHQGPPNDVNDPMMRGATFLDLVWLAGDAWVATGDLYDVSAFETDPAAWITTDGFATWTRDESGVFDQGQYQVGTDVAVRRDTREVFMVGFDQCGGASNGYALGCEPLEDANDGAVWIGTY